MSDEMDNAQCRNQQAKAGLRVLTLADDDAPAGTLRLCDVCGDVIEMVHEEVGWIHTDGHLEQVCGPDWEENIVDTMRAAQSVLKVALHNAQALKEIYEEREKGEAE